MKPILHSLERWLILDESVFESILGEPRDPLGLLQFRIGRPLVELVPPAVLGKRLRSLHATGCRHVHVVAEQLVPALLESLRALLIDGQLFEVHDWYRSSDEVMMSLEAPDEFIIDRLTDSASDLAIALWPPQASFDEGAALISGYRTALAQWEADAREEHGDAFIEHYGESIPWNDILPAWTPQTTDRWGLKPGLSRLFRFAASERGVGSARRLLGFAASEVSSETGATARLWSYNLEGSGLLEIRIDLPSRAGANVELVAAISRGARRPLAIVLLDERGETLISTAKTDWSPFGPSGGRVSYHSFPDEFGDLRSLILALRVQPNLMLVSA